MTTKSLVPKSAIEDAKMKALRKDTADFRTWVRTSKDGSEFLVNGEPIGDSKLTGVVVDFNPNWTRWPDGSEKPEKMYQELMPKGDGWKKRCDLQMMTAEYGIVVLDLPFSAYRNFGKFVMDVKAYGKSLADIFTRAVIGKGKSKKYGLFNTIRFEIGGLIDGSSFQKAETLPEGDDVLWQVNESEEPPPHKDGDFIPY